MGGSDAGAPVGLVANLMLRNIPSRCVAHSKSRRWAYLFRPPARALRLGASCPLTSWAEDTLGHAHVGSG